MNSKKKIFLAIPKYMIFAIQCSKPDKIKTGTDKNIETELPFLKPSTAKYINIPQKNPFISISEILNDSLTLTKL